MTPALFPPHAPQGPPTMAPLGTHNGALPAVVPPPVGATSGGMACRTLIWSQDDSVQQAHIFGLLNEYMRTQDHDLLSLEARIRSPHTAPFTTLDPKSASRVVDITSSPGYLNNGGLLPP